MAWADAFIVFVLGCFAMIAALHRRYGQLLMQHGHALTVSVVAGHLQ